MQTITPTTTLEHSFSPVKLPLNSQLSLFPDSMRPHSKVSSQIIRGNRDKVWRDTRYYGVSSYRRILPRELFIKRYDRIRECLQTVLRLPPAEREFTLRAARFGSYYGQCYAKIATLCQEPGCSKATAFRVLRKLQDQGLVTVIPRYLEPYRRQISSLILFHKLFLLIARYLAEHGQAFLEKWLTPYLALSWPLFWSWRGGWITPSARTAPLNCT